MAKPDKDKTHSIELTFDCTGGEHMHVPFRLDRTDLETVNLLKLNVAAAMIIAGSTKTPSKEFGGKNVRVVVKTVIDGRESRSASKVFESVDLGTALDIEDSFLDGCKLLNAWQRGIVPVAAHSSRAAAAGFQPVQIISPKIGEVLPPGAVLKAEFAGTGPIFSRVIAPIGGRYIPVPGAAIDVTEWAGLAPGWYGVCAWNVDPVNESGHQGVIWDGDVGKWLFGAYYAVRWVQIV